MSSKLPAIKSKSEKMKIEKRKIEKAKSFLHTFTRSFVCMVLSTVSEAILNCLIEETFVLSGGVTITESVAARRNFSLEGWKSRNWSPVKCNFLLWDSLTTTTSIARFVCI